MRVPTLHPGHRGERWALMSDVLKKKMQTATLVEKAVFAGGRLGVFKLKPDNGARWWYNAGQYTTLGLDTAQHGFVPRAYSIAGSPLDDGVLEFYIALVDNGKLTPTIFAQELGATFFYLTPKGKFTLKAAAKRTVVMVATGTGLAPFVSHVRSLWKLHQSGVPTPYRIILFYGAAYADEFGYRGELEGYAKARADGFDFTFICTSSRPDPARGWTPAIAKGRVNEVVRLVFGQPIPEGRVVALPEGVDQLALKELVRPDETAFMTCGNPGMIEDLKEPAHAIGVGTYLVEEFWKA
jgi:ferredoxin-NADP reductase